MKSLFETDNFLDKLQFKGLIFSSKTRFHNKIYPKIVVIWE